MKCALPTTIEDRLDDLIWQVGKRQAAALVHTAGQAAAAVDPDRRQAIAQVVGCMKQRIKRMKRK